MSANISSYSIELKSLKYFANSIFKSFLDHPSIIVNLLRTLLGFDTIFKNSRNEILFSK
mgnify:CR=1 FL=1